MAWSALLTSVVLSVAVGPAHAAPDSDLGDQIPNVGLRPVPDRPLQLPGAPAAPAAVPGLSPLAQQIITKQTEMEQSGERLKELNQEHAAAVTNLALADRTWREAGERLDKAKAQADVDAAKAYKATVGLPPNITSDLQNLSALSPVTGDDIPGLGSARELLLAQQEESDTYQAYLASIKAEQTKVQEYFAEQAEFKRREAAYLALRQQHADELAAIERERERRDQALGAQYIAHGSLNGFAASRQAIAAVNTALAQLGKPYVWGAEGPNSFDCSGLMWYSYLHGPNPGYNLPRVAKDQYNGTKSRTVSRYALLPGDLLFFATNPNDWTTVHHVGMYLGDGKMVHAPHTGDVVKISTVWWSEFFAATRVFGEVVASPAGNGTTTPPSGGGTTTPPSGGASTTPPSGGGNSPSPTPSPTPSTVTVPTNLVGATKETAQRQLTLMGLGVDFKEVDSDKPKDQVVNVPDAGKEVEAGQTIVVEISKGNLAEVTNVVGMTEETAKGILEGNFTVVVDHVDTASADQVGRVQSQDPPGGEKLAKGATVTIVVYRAEPSPSTEPSTADSSTPSEPASSADPDSSASTTASPSGS